MRAVDLAKLLPADIPPGEQVLWHGRPQWVSLGRRAFRADFVAGYFAAMAIWNFASAGRGSGWFDAAAAALETVGIGLAALALLGLLAWLSARTTLYVVTTRRVIFKIGIALPIFFNIPFKQVDGASVRAFEDGSGDIPLAIKDGQRIAYLNLWPHARPFRFKQPEPALRCVAAAAEVSAILARALVAASGAPDLTRDGAATKIARQASAASAVRGTAAA